MRYKFLIFNLTILFLFGCKTKEAEKADVANNANISIEQEQIQSNENALGEGLDGTLQTLILDYSKEYPIKKINANEKAVHQSYYVSFFKTKEDLMLAICRQPFVFELFPDFAFTDETIPSKKPTPKGILKNSNLPVIIFDTDENIGSKFYDDTFLNSKIPNKYYAEEEVSHDNSIPPIFKYEIEGNKVILLGKSKSQPID